MVSERKVGYWIGAVGLRASLAIALGGLASYSGSPWHWAFAGIAGFLALSTAVFYRGD